MADTDNELSLVNEMIRTRAKGTGATEAETVRQILAQIAKLPDDTALICGPSSTRNKVTAGAVRRWASQYGTLPMTR